ncbi:MAG: T9SS type A sorting domain-containing protein, partial [Bacteroidetes bacterium]|nr:T9SS type A sorting domain-containing protein [Bacteroidota bacterium]
RMRVLFTDGGFRRPLLASPAAVVAAPAQGSGISAALSPPIAGLFPNPAMSSTTVKLTETGGVLGVYNLMGARVMVERVTQTSVQLDLAGLASGIYFIRLEGKGGGVRLVKM